MKFRNYFSQFHLSLKGYKTGLMRNKANNHPFQAILLLGFRPKTANRLDNHQNEKIDPFR